MKKHLIISLIISSAFALANAKPPHSFSATVSKMKQDTLSDYTGKYELSRNKSLYVTLTIEKGSLVVTQSWDNTQKHLDHLNGDNYIVSGIGWSVQFVRGTDKKVTQMIVSSADTWNKVNN
jgi:hypothetical protein